MRVGVDRVRRVFGARGQVERGGAGVSPRAGAGADGGEPAGAAAYSECADRKHGGIGVRSGVSVRVQQEPDVPAEGVSGETVHGCESSCDGFEGDEHGKASERQ